MGGLNETFAALELSGLVLAVVLALSEGPLRGRSPSSPFLLVAGAVGAGLALLLVISAPGNAFRQAFYPPPPGLPAMLSISAASFLAFLGQIVGQPREVDSNTRRGWRGGVYGAASVRPLVRNPGLRRWFLLSALAFHFCAFLPAAYGLSDAPPERTLMIPAHLLVATIMLSSFVAASRIASGRPRRSVEDKSGGWNPGSRRCIVDSCGRLCRTDGSLPAAPRMRLTPTTGMISNAQILRARAMGADQILIEPMDNWAGLNEPNDNPKFWVNVCYRQYYGIEVLAASQP